MHQLTKKYPKKRAFITGGASGLGKAVALELAKDGWTFGLADLNQERLQEAAAEIEKAGGHAHTYILDVADREAYQLIAEQYLHEVGGVDLLMNNAGVGDGSFFDECSLANWDDVISINQMGVIYGCHYFVPALKQQGHGHVINTASAAAYSSGHQMAAYNVTKAAVLALSETLHTELKGSNIDVSVVMPLFFNSNLDESTRGTDETKEITRALIHSSNVTSEMVALDVLKQAGKNKLYIYGDSKSRWLHRFKRFFPGIFNWLKIKSVEKEASLKLKIMNKYKKKLAQQQQA